MSRTAHARYDSRRLLEIFEWVGQSTPNISVRADARVSVQESRLLQWWRRSRTLDSARMLRIFTRWKCLYSVEDQDYSSARS